jgi:hypothetical protein
MAHLMLIRSSFFGNVARSKSRSKFAAYQMGGAIRIEPISQLEGKTLQKKWHPCPIRGELWDQPKVGWAKFRWMQPHDDCSLFEMIRIWCRVILRLHWLSSDLTSGIYPIRRGNEEIRWAVAIGMIKPWLSLSSSRIFVIVPWMIPIHWQSRHSDREKLKFVIQKCCFLVLRFLLINAM